MEILGQEKLLSKLSSYSYSTFPRSSILLGPNGCGKKTVSAFIASKFNLELVNMTEEITQEFITNISLRVIPTLYVIDASLINERQQNMILKFLEEPNDYSFIVILTRDRVSLLPTIVNRCVVFEFERYTKEVLSMFIDSSVDKELALNVCSTPGQLQELKMINMNELHELCKKIVSKMSVASFPNTLTISDKLNFKDEYNKFGVDMFFNMLIYVLFTSYKDTNDKNALNMYLTTVDYAKKMRDKRLNFKHMVENYLSALWKKVRE